MKILFTLNIKIATNDSDKSNEKLLCEIDNNRSQTLQYQMVTQRFRRYFFD